MQQNPNDTNPFTPEELIWHDDFRAWVLHPTPERSEHWHNWLTQHPHQADTLLHARDVVLALGVNDRAITDASIQEVIAITRQHLDRPATALVRPLRTKWNWVAAAGVAMVLLAGLGYWWRAGVPGQVAVPTALVSTNTTTAAQTVQLPDGSRVQLAAGSRLRYPEPFAAAVREVYLTGTATFTVERNPDQPFLVHANGSVTRVLGTRFTVQAPDGGNHVTVNVLSGKVSVLPESEWARARQQAGYRPRTVIITANQQVVFEPGQEVMQKSIVAVPALQQPVSLSRFNFTNAPVADVFKTLEEAYGIPIVYDAAQLKQCVVTAPLAGEPLLDKLDIICETIGARYEVVEAQIVISGKGCPP